MLIKFFKLMPSVVLITLPFFIGIFYDWHLSEMIFSSLVILFMLYPLKSFVFFCATIFAISVAAISYMIGQKEISSEVSIWVFFLFILCWLAVVWEIVIENRDQL